MGGRKYLLSRTTFVVDHSGTFTNLFQFLSERLYVAQSTSQEEVKLYINLLQHSLSGEVDYLARSRDNRSVTRANKVAIPVRARLSRSMAAMGVRFRLAKMALGLLHSATAAYTSQSDVADNLSTGSGTTGVGAVSTNVSPTPMVGVVGPTNIPVPTVGTAATRLGSGAWSLSKSYSSPTALILPPIVRLSLREKIYSTLINYFRCDVC